MTRHAAHAMNDNSLASYREDGPKLSRRAGAIYDYLGKHGPRTDRELMSEMGFPDMNCVRPRVSELLDRGKLMKLGNVLCPVTHKMVRRVDVRRPRQLNLLPEPKALLDEARALIRAAQALGAS